MDDLVKRLRNHIAVVIDDKGHAFESETLCDEAAARIEHLEARVAAADKLIEDLTQHEGAEGFSQSTGDLLAAYEATKEQSE